MSAAYAKSTYLFGRGLGLALLVAFVSWHAQQAGLIGARGITPAAELLEAWRANGLGFADAPTLAWWVGASDGALAAMCWCGELAALLLLLGVLPGPSALAGGALYLSLHTIGGPFMAFQWDLLLIETATLGALVSPWRLFHAPSAVIEPPAFARWAIYALAFRLMFLSGVVKLASGDDAWARLRALDYHYFTQPLPGPLSWPAHQLPAWAHAASTAMVFAVELVLPFAIVLALLATAVHAALTRARLPYDASDAPPAEPRAVRVAALVARVALRAAGVGFVGLMLVIALTGNYGFFNLLTIVIALPLFDDAFVERLLPRRLRERLTPGPRAMHVGHRVVRLAQCSLLLFVYWLGGLSLAAGLGAGPSLPAALHDDLAAARPYRVANGYGLFAVMTRLRREIRVEGTLDGVEWREYVFAHKPGDPRALPGQSAPHMPRLDWQMWFAALGTARQSPWLHRFMLRLLAAEPSVLALLAEDPFGGRPPRCVRATLWDYRFGDVAHRAEHGAYWVVEELGPFAPPRCRR
ncbi:MAG: lipase maturation factor family protein [Sandaracinaceae bacterium]|nr:lipase maturation factor family protein [Sandaracinaceae bacterium]